MGEVWQAQGEQMERRTDEPGCRELPESITLGDTLAGAAAAQEHQQVLTDLAWGREG